LVVAFLDQITIVDSLDLASCNFIIGYLVLTGNITAITTGSNLVEVMLQTVVVKTNLKPISDRRLSLVVILGYPSYLVCVSLSRFMVYLCHRCCFDYL
jgi:hypothetical protein